MDEKHRQAIRGVLLERYGLDIDEATCHFSTQNHAFIFPGKPYMIRVSMTSAKTRREILAEMMWVDDLKQFKQTICEPNTSLHGKLLEEFEIDGATYRASMFRTARGVVEPVVKMTPMFFICVGDLLGTIHHVSTNERELGINYQRKTLADQFADRKARTFAALSPAVRTRIEEVEAKVNALPQELGVYGICHGDFHTNNFLVEANNVWLFDFDGCCYANYLYDVASFIQACFMRGYGAGGDCRKALYEEMLPYLKIGYEINKPCEPHYWDHLELMLAYRSCYALMALAGIDARGSAEIERAKDFFSRIIVHEDILGAMSAVLSGKA